MVSGKVANHSLSPQETTPPKRLKQRKPYTKRACINCKNAHAGCDSERPCKRCVSLGIENDCVDAERKKPTRKANKKPKNTRDTPVYEEQQTQSYPYHSNAINYQQIPPYSAYLPFPQFGYPTQLIPTNPQQQAMASAQQLLPYVPYPPMWTGDPNMQTFPLANGYYTQPHNSNVKKNIEVAQPDSEDEEGSEEENALETPKTEADGESMILTPTTIQGNEDIFQIDSELIPMYESPLNTESLDADGNNSTALTLHAPSQSKLQLHSQHILPSLQESFIDDFLTPSSPLHRNTPTPKTSNISEDDDVEELITNSAADMLSENNSKQYNHNNDKKDDKKNKTVNSTQNNSSLVHVNDRPIGQILADLLENANNPSDMQNNSQSIQNFLEEDNVKSANSTEIFDIESRSNRSAAATLTREQMEKLLRHVWETQTHQTQEIRGLKSAA
ncbi:hypothetical protein AKO1_005929 [Acrasis kona]|uniref:Zn(2)-C6 fungal-type domain-containing protein n=1 Tax=Acrasis kona TaxID=1008807 RepID=A0AAW2YJE9_9EUKA